MKHGVHEYKVWHEDRTRFEIRQGKIKAPNYATRYDDVWRSG